MNDFTVVAAPGWLNLILFGFLVGFGWAAGTWLFGLIVGAIARRHKEP